MTLDNKFYLSHKDRVVNKRDLKKQISDEKNRNGIDADFNKLLKTGFIV